MKKFLTLFAALLLLGSMTVVQATDYYYRGNQNGWGATLMTTSTDGYYAYISAKSYANNGNANNNFKISLTADGWDYSCYYASAGFNETDITDMNSNSNSWNDDSWNNAIYHTSDYYVLVYFPNTDINPSSDPVICASTTLPNNSAPASDVYTVVGDVPGLGWTPENTDLDMTENNGVYTFAMENVELTANTAYYYKMVQNHSWDVSYPAGSANASFSVDKSGIYDLTFTLNLSASPEYSVTPDLVQEIVVIPTIKMKGTFADGTNWAETAEFTLAGNNETATLTLENLPAGTYDFLVMSGSSYLGNGHTFYREYTGASNITGNEGNMHLEADVAGNYTFTWTYENNALIIGFPAEPTPEMVEIKFFAPRDETNKWEHVYAYSYKGSRKFIGEWPGTEITSTKNAGWYTVSVRKGSNLIFTDNAGMQTENIEDIQVTACYEPTSINYDVDPKLVTVVANANCEIAYHIAGVKELVGGTEDWKTYLPLDENNQIVFQNVEPGTYAFKINNNSWAWSIGGISHMKEGDCATIAQEVGTGDLGFKIDTKQDVTVTYYPETQEICLGAVTVKATTTVEGTDMSIKAGESKKISYTTNNTENPNVTYTVLSGAENIGMFKGVITGVKPGETVIRVSLAETANYTAASDEFTITISNAAAPAKAIEAVGGKFIINAKGDTAVFSRGNLKYNVATQEWYCSDHQYDFVGEGGNLHFGDANYTGEFDLFGWSCTASNYGLMQSNHDEVYTGEFVDWGGKFSDEKTWSTLSSSQWQYMQAHQNWTMMALDPTPEVADNEDEIRGMALFPYDWVTPAGFESLHMKFYDLDDEAKLADNTIALSDWSTLEAAGAVFLPMAGARAGHWGNTWNGKAETTTKNSNPNAGQSYCFVDNEGWYGYYWLATTDSRSDHPYDAMYLICPSAYNTGELDEHDEEIWAWSAPAVWSREKRRGNSVRLVNIVPRQYTVTYDANGAEGEVIDNNKYLDGAAISLPAATGLSKDGYEFAGWAFKGQTYNAGDEYTINNVLANEEIIFVAQWTLIPYQRDGLTAGRYGTICLPNAGTIDGAKLYDLEYFDGANTLYLLEVNGNAMEAGHPYIFLPSATSIEVSYTDHANAAAGSFNGLVGSYSQEIITADAGNYILYNNAYYLVNSLAYVGENRAYIHMSDVPTTPTQNADAPRRRVAMNVYNEQTTTDIDALNASETPVKMIIDGNLYILRGEKLYNVNGQVVK